MALTGENFKMLNRSQNTKLKNELEEAKTTFTKYAKNADSENWNWQELRKLELEVERLDYEVWAENYEDKRRRNWG